MSQTAEPLECRVRDTSSVACANDALTGRPYAPLTMGHRERSKVMKRTIVIAGIAGALLVAPSVASAASVPQVRSQVVESQLVRSQLVRSQQVRSQVVRSQQVRSQVLRSQRAGVLRISQVHLQLR